MPRVYVVIAASILSNYYYQVLFSVISSINSFSPHSYPIK